MKLLNQWWHTPFFIRLVGFLCLLGTVNNVLLLGKDMGSGSVLWQLHAGFLLLYAGQVFFILTQEKYVAVLTLLQGLAALATTADFMFVPLLQIAGLFYWFSNPPVDTQSVYKYIFVSAAFTLQLASAGYLWFYFREQEVPVEDKSVLKVSD